MKFSKIKSVRLFATITFSLLATACINVPLLPEPAPIKTSSFQGLLKNNPGGEWPRVAVTIHKLEADAYKPGHSVNGKLTANGKTIRDLCMRVSAVVWTGPKQSRTIPEESFCGNQGPARWVEPDVGSYILWAGANPTKGTNTGLNRTNGPNPPRTAFPQGTKYGNFIDSLAYRLLLQLTLTMEFDMTVAPSQDRRLWIVSIPGQTDL